VSASSVILVAGDGGLPTGTFTLTAAGGPVAAYGLTVTGSTALTVSPSAGSLAEGQSVTIALTLDGNTALNAQIVINPCGAIVDVQYTPAKPTPPPPPPNYRRAISW
jgi:hypothetical protein